VIESQETLRSDEVFYLFIDAGPPAVTKYLHAMCQLETQLTKFESIVMVKLILQNSKNNGSMLTLWLGHNLLTLSQEVAEIIRPFDVRLAADIYVSVSVPDKVIDCFLELNDYEKIIRFATSFRYKTNWISMLTSIHAKNPLEALRFASLLAEAQGGSPVELDQVCVALEIPLANDDWDFKKIILKKYNEMKEKLIIPKGE